MSRRGPLAGPTLPLRGLTFGLGLFTGQSHARGSALYRQAAPLAQEAEEAGFDAFWVSEHHGLADGYLPDPLTLLAAVAARTRTIRLGTGLLIAPLHHPVRLAEQAAVVDQISDGRLLLGLGLGYAEHEYRTFDVDPRGRGDRLRDLIALLRTAWTGETFDWDGPALQAREIRVTPVPVQGAGLPIWLGGYATAALRRSAREGDGHLIGRGDRDIVTRSVAGLTEAGAQRDDGFTLGLNLLVAFTDDPIDLDAVRTGFLHQQLAYEAMQRGADAFAGQVSTPTEPLQLPEVDRYFHALGDVDELVDRLVDVLDPLRSWANVHVVLRALVPQSELDPQLRRVRRLGEQVVPRVRARLT